MAVLARRSIIDIPTILIALCVVSLLRRFKKLREPVVIAAVPLAGSVHYLLLRR